MLEISNLICTTDETIEAVFQKMDDKDSNILFVVDQKDRLVGRVEKSLLRSKVLSGISSGDSISDFVEKDIAFLIDTETQNEQELKSKINYLKNKFLLSTEDLVPICDNEMRILSMSTIEALLHAEDQRKNLLERSETINSVKDVCIIGGGGYLGTVLAEKLLALGYNVKIFDCFVFGKEAVEKLKKAVLGKEEFGKLDIYEGDMRSTSDLVNVLEGADAAVLLGAVVGDPASTKYPISTFEVNYLAAQTIAEICAYLNINRFIFASTCSVYGHSETNSALDESAKLNPVSHYARTKINAEKAVLRLDSSNFAPTILRMSTLYGPSFRMRYDLVVNTMMMRGIANKKITVFGGKQWRPLLSVDDAAEAYVSVIKADIGKVKRQVFNVGDERENYQIIDLGKMIGKFLKDKGREIEVEIVEHDVDERDYKVSFEKIKSELGYSVKDSVEDTLEELYQRVMDQFEKDLISDASNYNVQNEFKTDVRGGFLE